MGEVEASTRMDGRLELEAAAERTVVAASATAAARGRILLAPADRRGRWQEEEHSPFVILAFIDWR